MAKNRKKRKLRKAWVKSSKRKFSNKLELQNDLGELIVNSIQEDFEILETEFGPIKMSDEAVFYALRNKGAFLPITSLAQDVPEDDYIEILLGYERLNQEFPEEPFIHVQIAGCYKVLNQEEKYTDRLEANFLDFQGYPSVDIEYSLSLGQMSVDQYESIFGKELNIHDLYPDFKAFDSYTITKFYVLKTKYYVDLKEYETAKNCVEIVKMLDLNGSRLLSSMVSYQSDPAFRRKTKLLRVLFLILVISIIGGAIWGIIKLFQWIF